MEQKDFERILEIARRIQPEDIDSEARAIIVQALMIHAGLEDIATAIREIYQVKKDEL